VILFILSTGLAPVSETTQTLPVPKLQEADAPAAAHRGELAHRPAAHRRPLVAETCYCREPEERPRDVLKKKKDSKKDRNKEKKKERKKPMKYI